MKIVKFDLGIKSDPIEYRYSYEWLFELMSEMEVPFLQLGTFFEFYWVELKFFENLKRLAEKFNIKIKSIFTAHQELGGILTGDPFLEKVARKGLERLIEIGEILEVDYVGASMGGVYRVNSL